jgi:hypothetical protein
LIRQNENEGEENTLIPYKKGDSGTLTRVPGDPSFGSKLRHKAKNMPL